MRAIESRDKCGHNSKKAVTVYFQTAVRLQRTKPFSGLGVKEISRATGVFFKMQRPNVCFCHANKQPEDNER